MKVSQELARQVFLLNSSPTIEATSWPSGIALPTSDHGLSGSSSSGGEIISEPKRRFIAQSLSCSPFHRPDMTEILLKESLNRNSSSHPSTEPYSTDDLSVYSVEKYSRARWQWNISKWPWSRNFKSLPW